MSDLTISIELVGENEDGWFNNCWDGEDVSCVCWFWVEVFVELFELEEVDFVVVDLCWSSASNKNVAHSFTFPNPNDFDNNSNEFNDPLLIVKLRFDMKKLQVHKMKHRQKKKKPIWEKKIMASDIVFTVGSTEKMDLSLDDIIKQKRRNNASPRRNLNQRVKEKRLKSFFIKIWN